MRFKKYPESCGRSQKEREYTSLMKFSLSIVVEDTKVQFSSVWFYSHLYFIFTQYIVSRNKITNKRKKSNRTLMALVEVYGG